MTEFDLYDPEEMLLDWNFINLKKEKLFMNITF